jgi:hypothetical protein
LGACFIAGINIVVARRYRGGEDHDPQMNELRYVVEGTIRLLP